jgi:hypothetical protein
VKLVFIGLSLLLFLSFPFTQESFALAGLSSQLSVPPALMDMILASITVALYLRICRIQYRVIHPIRGRLLLSVGLLLYTLTILLSGLAFALWIRVFGYSDQNPWSALIPSIVVSKYSDYVLLLVKSILLLGALRFFSNLLPEDSSADPNLLLHTDAFGAGELKR